MGVKESLIGHFLPYRAWWCQISQNKNFGLFFQKSLGTQESFCKVSDRLDKRLNNYGLISRHTSSINCVNNCTFIFTRHQPRLFLKALLVMYMSTDLSIGVYVDDLYTSMYLKTHQCNVIHVNYFWVGEGGISMNVFCKLII